MMYDVFAHFRYVDRGSKVTGRIEYNPGPMLPAEGSRPRSSSASFRDVRLFLFDLIVIVCVLRVYLDVCPQIYALRNTIAILNEFFSDALDGIYPSFFFSWS